MWFIILFSIFVYFIYITIIKPFKYWKEKGVTSVKGWPIVGNIGQSIIRKRAFAHILEDIYYAYPERRYVGFHNLTVPTLMIRDPDLIKKITVKEFDTFPEHRPLIPEGNDPLWNKNLFAMKGGEKWQDMRATLSPSFTSSKMRMMFELMKECATQFTAHFLKQGGMVTVEMKDAFTRFTNDVIATTAFGITCDSLEHRENEFYIMGKEATTFGAFRIFTFIIQGVSPTLGKLLGNTVFSKAVSRFFRGLITETIKVREEQGTVRPDMVHLLMEARKAKNSKLDDQTDDVLDTGFAVVQESKIGKTKKRQRTDITDEDITAQALIFFLAGFDTVSTAMCYASYELALHPDIQTRLRMEIDEALEKCNGKITYETLLGLKYLDMVVTETLRKWPPFVFLDRRAVKPFVIPAEKPGETDVYLEEGSVCFISVYSIQRDANNYPNPEKFDPERFSDENKHKIDPFVYLPFGAGPRNCIGSRFALLEVKLVLLEIISKFEIVPVEKTPIPIVLTKITAHPVPDEGFWLGLKPRSNEL